ncbi:hypothetical protein NHH73_12880 [Oxalobacteraceae bacterium OTU3CINTB1]|nr:hypothetical protein NHH73_12880 [Oxalobacteraceae bacterium OTU3CINTB1]
MIQLYPAPASVLPGQRLVLHVSTDQPRFRVHFFRWSVALQPVLRSDWLRGEHAPPRGPDQDWHWPAYGFEIPGDWRSAVYIACCETDGAPPPAPWMPQAAALFVVRGATRGSLLVKLPLATWHAYNHSGGGCFYDNPPRSTHPPGARLSLRRPGGGIGGAIFGAPDHYDTSSPRQSFAHWDARFIRWLLRNGYEPAFCTDFDIHADPDLCGRYSLLLSAGHDEYWSEPARDHVEAFIANGGNAAFFGANLCWWRIHYVDQGLAMVCHQGGPQGALDHWWPRGGVGRPEDALGGASYRHGGGWWDGPRRVPGYTVHAADHWVFAGTGLRRGEVFGAATRPPLIGYECDGVPLEREAETGARAGAGIGASDALPRVALAASSYGTPATYELLASSVLGDDWQELPAREQHAAGQGIHAACMGLFERGGTVFSAGTTDWAQVLDSGQDTPVERITANVIDRLLSSGGAR